MSQFVSQPARPPSRPLILVGSLVIVFHLAAVGLNVLAAPSGPWPGIFEGGVALPPEFARVGNQVTFPTYLSALRLTNNYHFTSNSLEEPDVYFTVRLKDADGKEITSLRFPDPEANPWVRHRQMLLAQGLGGDSPLPPPRGEVVPAPGQDVRMVHAWKQQAQDKSIHELETQPEHTARDLLKEQPMGVFLASDRAVLLARAYARYLCRQHGAASAELVRHSANTVPPLALLRGMEKSDMTANFGELPR